MARIFKIKKGLVMKKLVSRKMLEFFNAPGFYIPASTAVLSLTLLFQQEVRQGLRLDPPNEEFVLPLPYEDQPSHYKKMTAYHEAGHLIVMMAMKRPHLTAEYITIRPKDYMWGHVKPHTHNVLADTKEDYLAQIAMLYGGYAAEKCFTGTTTDGVYIDIEMATECAMTMSKVGMGEHIPLDYEAMLNTGILDADTAIDLGSEVTNHLSAGYKAAFMIMETYNDKVEKLATALLKDPDQTLTYEEAKKIVGYDEKLGLTYIGEDGKKYYFEDPIATFFPPPEENIDLENQEGNASEPEAEQASEPESLTPSS